MISTSRAATRARREILVELSTAADVEDTLITILDTTVTSEVKVRDVFTQSGACAALYEIPNDLSRLADLTCGGATATDALRTGIST